MKYWIKDVRRLLLTSTNLLVITIPGFDNHVPFLYMSTRHMGETLLGWHDHHSGA